MNRSTPRWLRRTAVLTSVSFLWTALFATPLQVAAQLPNKPAFGPPKPIPAPIVHDDPAWHTIDYHAQEHARPSVANNAVPAPLTLLDEVGRLAQPVDANKVAEWKRQLHYPRLLPSTQAAKLHLWLGEYVLAHDEQPEAAQWHFVQAQKASRCSQTVYGVAAYDKAVAAFTEGAYKEAQSAFQHVLAVRPALHGFDRRACALFLRHAGACAGYHQERAAIGIPEPPRLDPLCGAAALAQSLKTLGKPYDKKTLLANVRVTGRGSTLGDVLAGARKMGLSARIVTADDKGLIALPKPLVAYVEHDHFLSVLHADKQGVAYLCSDCGAWPGGQVRLTWKQWHKLEATLYGVITRPNSPSDKSLSGLQAEQERGGAGVQVASLASLALPRLVAETPLLRRLRKHVQMDCGQLVYRWLGNNPDRQTAGCGNTQNGLKCYVCKQKCALDKPCPAPGASGPVRQTSIQHPDKKRLLAGISSKTPILLASAAGETNLTGAQAGDPVNLATGEEEYTPGPDLVVYNPLGPSVVWSRLYDSLRPDTGVGYRTFELGEGWSQTYNVGVYDPTLKQGLQGALLLRRGQYAVCQRGGSPNAGGGGGGTWTSQAGVKYLVEANGARIALTAPSVPTAANPRVTCTTQAGFPILAEWDYNATTSNFYFTLTFADRTKWITTNGATPCLSQIVDRNGNAITFNLNANGLLSTITDKNNQALLTIVRSGNSIAHIDDRYGRSVYYHVGTYATSNVTQGYAQSYQELDHVSQTVLTGTASPPDRYAYGYQNVGTGDNTEAVPLLHTITVPSPTGTGTQTATINYENGTMGVSSLVDANGNSRSYQQIDANHTQVTIQDPQANIVYRYTAGYDMNMSLTSLTNGLVDGNGKNTQIVQAITYADPNDPYSPSQVQDGNGYAAGGANNKGTWAYTWDSLGHCLTGTSPRGATTTNTYTYTNFALGELTKTQTVGKQAVTYAYYEPSGNVQSVISPLPGTVNGTQSVTTSYTYSALGNLLTMTTPGNGTVASMTTTYGYTSDGSFTQNEALGQPLTLTDNLGKITHVRYDTQGRATSVADALGNTTNLTYNIIGQMYQSLSPATGQTGSGRTTTQNTYLYPGGPLTQTILYNESGVQVRQVTPVYGKEGEQLGATGDLKPVSTAYDALYRPKTLTDGNSHATAYAYATAGYTQQAQIANGDTYKATAWDANGNVLTSIDGRGTTVNYVYNDVESRLTDIQYPATPALNVHVDYDNHGRAYHLTDNVGSKTANFDDRNAPTSISTTYLNAARTGNLPVLSLIYGYNPNGSRSSLSTPGGSFSYGYDGRGLPNSLGNPYGETFAWTYLDNGWLWTQSLSSLATSTYTYNALGQVTDLAHRKSNNALLADFGSMSQDAVGNRLSLTANLPAAPASYSGSTTYGYDNRSELTQETSGRAGGYNNGYGYDFVGNPTTWKGNAQSFNLANQNTQGGTLTFDGNGNPAGWQGTPLSWDANNKLTAFGSALTAGYGADGLRAWKQTAAGRTYFVYDGLVPVCETDTNGNVTAVNTWGANGLLARRAGGSSVFYAFDPQGSVSVRLDSSGNVLSSHCNDAWGTQVSTVATSDPYAGYGGQWGYYRDSETGLHLLGHRYYDASSGRFLNRDPIGYSGGVNMYAYCASNPSGRKDPSGFQFPGEEQIIDEGEEAFSKFMQDSGIGNQIENDIQQCGSQMSGAFARLCDAAAKALDLDPPSSPIHWGGDASTLLNNYGGRLGLGLYDGLEEFGVENGSVTFLSPDLNTNLFSCGSGISSLINSSSDIYFKMRGIDPVQFGDYFKNPLYNTSTNCELFQVISDPVLKAKTHFLF